MSSGADIRIHLHGINFIRPTITKISPVLSDVRFSI
jgi:hypothetical protein